MLAPEHETDLAEFIKREPLALQGLSTKKSLGKPACGTLLSLASFKGIHLYEPDELVLEAGAATPLNEITQLLSSAGQHLAFDPPDYSALLGSASSGSLGGVISCGLAGPGRLKYGGPRDHILGISGVSGRGDIFKAGGRVVKNVTGFDLSKLVVGAYGTLAALTRITFKTVPKPETQITFLLSGLSDAQGSQALQRSLQIFPEVSAAAHISGERSQTLLRLDTVYPAVTKLRDELTRLLADFGSCTVVSDLEAEALWRAVRDVTLIPASEERLIWRLLVPPASAAKIMAQLSACLPSSSEPSYFYDWGGGLIWLSLICRTDGYADLIRGQIGEGQAMLFKAPEEIRKSVSIFQPQSQALAELSSRVKAAFDPRDHLNPFRSNGNW